MGTMCDNFIIYEDNQNEFKMWQGLVGAHYTPYVDGAGNLSWTNNGGLPNPPTVNVTGKGLTITGIVATTGDLPATANQFDTYLVGTADPYYAYMYYENAWVNIGAVGKGEQGDPGFSPVVTVSSITGGHQISITDAEDTETFNVMDGADGAPGQDGVGVPTGGTTGQVLAKASGTDYDTEWVDQSGGGGNVQSVNNVTPDQTGNITLTADDIGTDANNISIQDALDGYVHVGTSAPTDPTTKIWLDTDEPGMSAVSSVNGKTGTVVIDDIPMTLLWTNASPTSSFANQTITIDLSDYDAVLVKSKIVTDINGVFSQLFFKSSGYSYLFFVYTHIFYRFLEISDSGIVFGHCNYLSNYGASGFSVGDNYAIPLQIYGVKVVA